MLRCCVALYSAAVSTVAPQGGRGSRKTCVRGKAVHWSRCARSTKRVGDVRRIKSKEPGRGVGLLPALRLAFSRNGATHSRRCLVGKVMMMQANDYRGPIWIKPRQPDWTDMHWQMRNWYYFTWLSGDFNVEQHVHFLDVAAWIMKDE